MSGPAITALAHYLTGDLVARYSVALNLHNGGPLRLRENADAFFRLRAAFGVSGYAHQDEAAASIIRTITKEPT